MAEVPICGFQLHRRKHTVQRFWGMGSAVVEADPDPVRAASFDSSGRPVKPHVTSSAHLDEFVRKAGPLEEQTITPAPKGRLHFVVPLTFVPEVHEIAERGIERAGEFNRALV